MKSLKFAFFLAAFLMIQQRPVISFMMNAKTRIKISNFYVAIISIHPSIHPSIRSYYVKIELYSSIVIQFSGQMESRESRELESNSQRDGSLWNELYFRMQRNRWLSFEFEEDADTSSATGPSLFLSYLGSFFNLFTWPCFEQSKKSVPSNDPEVHRTWP